MRKTVHSVAETGFSGFLHQTFPWIFAGLDLADEASGDSA